MEEEHQPVLAEEVMQMLAPRPGSLHVDCTVGGGGHTERILEAASPDGRVLGLDADPAAIARVGERLARFGDRLVLRQANFAFLGEAAPDAGFGAVDGILLDLGLSSFQLADAGRGFGFRTGGPLDMRFDPVRGEPASPAGSPAPSWTPAEPSRSRPRSSWRPWWSGSCRAARARVVGSIPPPGSSRPSGSP
jgi:16S rRNA (cytosine1402-N4)-methyltransferase